MRTEALVNLLVEDMPSASPRFPRILAAGLLCGALLATAVLLTSAGIRVDLGRALGEPRIWFKFDFTLSLLLASLVLAQRSGEPGAPWGRWGYALLVAPALLVVGVGIECAVTPSSSWASRLLGVNALHCLQVIPLLSAGPLACVVLALRRGAPTNPSLSGALAGLVAGAVGAAFYATHCPDDSPLFVATWYPLGIGFVALAGAAAGWSLFRW